MKRFCGSKRDEVLSKSGEGMKKGNVGTSTIWNERSRSDNKLNLRAKNRPSVDQSIVIASFHLSSRPSSLDRVGSRGGMRTLPYRFVGVFNTKSLGRKTNRTELKVEGKEEAKLFANRRRAQNPIIFGATPCRFPQDTGPIFVYHPIVLSLAKIEGIR